MNPSSPKDAVLRGYLPGHSVRLLKDGCQAYPAMLAAIDEAERNVCLETYILRADKTGEKFASALMAKARAGVEVNLMYDAVGSLGLAASYLKKLSDARVRVLAYHPIFRRFRLSRLNRRNHRKSLIVDSRICFIGGINIADDYAPLEEGGGGWRETQLQIEGPSVLELESLFLKTWRRARGLRYSKELYGVPSKVKGNVRVRILANRTIHKRRKIRLAYLRAITLAEQRIWITNSYFLPDPILIRALLRAARRGVEIKILMGGSASDVPWVGFAARAIYGNFLRRGIKLYEWRGRVLHSKTAVVDGVWSTVGSYNLDYRSLLHNLEVNAGIMDKAFGEAMENMFCDDLLNADLIQYEVWRKRSWWNYFRDGIAYRLRFFL